MRKKALAFILAAAVLLSMAACGQKKEADSGVKNETAVQEAAVEDASAEKDAAGEAKASEMSKENATTDESAAEEAAEDKIAAEEASEGRTAAEQAAEGGTLAEQAAGTEGLLAGGWTLAESPVVSDEVKALLQKALERMTGAEYTPVAYLASQVVSGTNHAILCRIAPVVPDPEEKYGIVILYEDLQGNAEITKIMDFEANTNISDLDGGWTQAESPVLTEDDRVVFEKAMEGLVGVDYVPVALLSTQVVSGTNYCFLCEATVVYPGAETSYALVYVYADLNGDAEVTEIVNLAE